MSIGSFVSHLFGIPGVQNSAAETALRVQTSLQGLPIPVGWGQATMSGNLIWYGDFLATAHTTNSGGKGGVIGGVGKGSGSVSYTYQAAVQVALCEGPIGNISRVWSNKTETTLSELNMTSFLGNYSQTAWGYLTTNHPTQALNYRGLAYMAAGPLQLGTSQELPNINFEVTFSYNGAISGYPDADPKDVVTDLLTNVNYGLNFPSGLIGNLTTFSNYCKAVGLVVSPVLSDSTTANTFFDDLLRAVNSEMVWSNGLLTIVPRGDYTLTAHGFTYTAPSSAQFNLTDSDLLPNQASNPGSSAGSSSTDPIVVTRRPQQDQKNYIRVEYLYRTGQYDPAIMEAKDDALIQAVGVQAQTYTSHFFCDPLPAGQSAYLQLIREQIRNSYAFTLDPMYILLDPMDIVSLTDSKLGLSNQWVRIMEITENNDGSLSVIAEEYPAATNNSPTYTVPDNSGFIPDYNADPGNISTPMIFCPPLSLTNGANEVWIAASGNSTIWGGCQVWASSGNSTYSLVGEIPRGCRQGVTTNSVSRVADPDSTSTVSVNLTESQGTLVSVTSGEKDAFDTLSYLGGELIAYQYANLTSSYNYDLGTLRRGAYGTQITSHSSNTQFARLDGTILKLPFDAARLGEVNYFKFPSVNLWGQGAQSLGNVTQYTVTMGENLLSFHDILEDLNYETGAVMWLDSGDSLSYVGSGQTWTDRSPGNVSVYLGSGSGSDTHDPTFNGTGGDLLATTNFGGTGNVSYFTPVTGSNPSWINTFHKPGAIFTIIGLVSLSQIGVVPGDISILSTIDSGATKGFAFYVDGYTSNLCSVNLRIPGNALLTSNFLISATSDQWHMVAVSFSEGRQSFMVDGQVETSLTGHANTVTSTPNTFKVGGSDYSFLSGAFDSASKMAMVGVWNGVALSEASLYEIYQNVKLNRTDFDLP